MTVEANQRFHSEDASATGSGEGPPGRNLTPLAAAIMSILYPGTAAIAQDSDSGRLDEIVVTATKREMNMQDLGQSITALTTDDLEKQSMQGMEDYVRALPSVTLANEIPGRNSVIMRGVSTGTQEFYTDSQVAIYLDEQPVTTISQQLDVRMVDIARIEVLPGPQGTLFGSSSQAGTMRIITNQPDNTQLSGQVDAALWSTSGGEESYDLSGWINLPLVSDRLAVRAVAFTSHEGGYIDNILGTTLEGSEDNSAVVEEDQNEFDNVGGRIAATWVIDDAWEIDASYIAQRSETSGSWDSDPALGDFRLVKFFKEYREDDWYQASATIRGDLGFAEVTGTASYFDRDIVYEWDNMVYEQWKDAYWGPYYALYDSDYTFGTTFNDQNVTRSAYELRLTSQGESRMQWMIGGFYEDTTNQWFYGAKNPDYVGTDSWYAAQYYAYYYNYLGYDVQYPLPPTDIGYSETYRNSIKQTAVFGELGFDLTDRWTVTVGSRWFEYDRDTRFLLQFPQGLPPFGSFDTGGRVESSGVESDTVFKFGTTFDLTDNLMVYGLYSEGFRLGGNNSQRAANTGFVPLVYESDKVENVELGLKSSTGDGRLVFNLTAFVMEWDQIQINQSSVGGQWWLRGTINGGKAESKGAEAYVTWQATDNLYLEATAFFGSPEFKDEVVRFSDVVPAGAPMVWAPKRKYKAAVEYMVPDVLGGDLWFRYDYSYEGEKWNNLSNIINNNTEGLVPSWSISNVHVGLDLEGGWNVQLTARNIWDKRAINSLYQDSSGELFGDPRFDNIRTYARPRTIGVTVRKRFN